MPADDDELIDAVQASVPETHPEVGILAVDIPDKGISQTNLLSNEVEVLRSPSKLKGESKYLLYETLYERALGWSGSGQSGSGQSSSRQSNS